MRSGSLVRTIIWANVTVALISVLCYTFGWPDILREVMPLSWAGVMSGYLWQFFTYLWIHAQFEGVGVLHLVCNMMTLAPFGRAVETALGGRQLAGIYLAGGLGGAFGFVVETGLRQWLTGVGPEFDPGMVGASAAVLGVVTAFAILQPAARISILFLPFRIRAGRFLFGFGLVSLVLIFVPSLQFIAHSAHIGGMLGGWLWMRWLAGDRESLPLVRYSASGADREAIRREIANLDAMSLRVEADRVMDKIAREGVESLDERDHWILLRLRGPFEA